MSSIHERLSERFRRWEERGRGWQVFSDPVYPEPPFTPFPGHYLPEAGAVDDGRRPTFLSSLVQALSRKLSTEHVAPPALPDEIREPEPTSLIRYPPIEFQASLPEKLDIPGE